MCKFRDLRADEIECRVQSVKDNGLVLLLYKDARVDMNILDETVGASNWQREHYECKGNLFCRVGICVETKKGEAVFPEWVWKSDCGTESNTEAQKGEASDSFKRACFNWGIGRELYTAPFTWIPDDKCNIKEKKDRNGKPIYVCYDNFEVKHITIENKRITALEIYNITKKCTAFTFGMQKGKKAEPPKDEAPKAEPPKEFICADCGAAVDPAMAARTQKAFGVCLCVKCGLKRSEEQCASMAKSSPQ
jgi:hypothetical protein